MRKRRRGRLRGGPPPLPLRELIARALLLLGGFAAALALAEPLVRRLDRPVPYLLDAELGVRPRHGPVELAEDASTRGEGEDRRERLLFLGDSVTARGKIIAALQAAYGTERYRYFNGGMEGSDPPSELIYYKRYGRAVAPDHVILTLHSNDLQEQEFYFRSPLTGGEHRFIPGRCALTPYLWEHSALARLVMGSLLAKARIAPVRRDAPFVRRVRESIRELQALSAADGIRLSALVLPIFLPVEEWSEYNHDARRLLFEFLAELNVRAFDLHPPLEQALAAGVNVQQEPGDAWHPSDEAAAYFAAYLEERGLLDPRAP